MKQAVRKKRKKQIKKRNKLSVLFYSFLLVLFILSLLVVVYVNISLPKELNKKIKTILIDNYNPVIYQDDGSFILKLSKKPDQDSEKKLTSMFKEKFGFEVVFKSIATDKNRGINELVFLKNKKRIDGLSSVFIYWDESSDIKIIQENNVKKVVKQNEIGENEKTVNGKKSFKKDQTKIIEKIKENKDEKKSLDKRVAKIAIIIDDAGYAYNSTYDFIKSGIPMTFAYIPGVESDKKIYNLLKNSGYDIMLHVPMEPIKGKEYVEKNAIFTDMKEDDIKNRINSFLKEYPDIVGCNNHMGSKAVKDIRVMNSFFSVIKDNNIFWLDSRTDPETVANSVASMHGVKSYKRDVFLDNEDTESFINESMKKLISIAKKNGYAVGIGHIQSRNLVPVLKEYYENRFSYNIDFVLLKDL